MTLTNNFQILDCPKATDIKKALAAYNERRLAQNQQPISYTVVARAIAATGTPCSKSTVAQVLKGKYSSLKEGTYRTAIYQALIRWGMPAIQNSESRIQNSGEARQVRADLTGFVRVNRLDYYVGGLAGKTLTIEPGAEPNTIRVTHPMQTGDLRPLDKSTTQLDPTPSHGRRRWSSPGQPGGPGTIGRSNPRAFRRELNQRPIRGGAALELLVITPVVSAILFAAFNAPIWILAACFAILFIPALVKACRGGADTPVCQSDPRGAAAPPAIQNSEFRISNSGEPQ